MDDKRHILIVEDNKIVALDLRHSLENEGHLITSIEKSFNGVKKSIKTTFPDIAIIDINLGSKENGIEIGKYLHKYEIPIIYSTSYSDTETINKALETDPVCYLVKPINLQELLSNITLGLYKRKFKLNSQVELINKDYSFDSRLNKLLYQGTPIPLSKMEVKLVKIILTSKDDVALFEDIEYHLWKNKPIKSSALRTIVYRLRRKLPVELVQTVPNLGFSFIK